MHRRERVRALNPVHSPEPRSPKPSATSKTPPRTGRKGGDGEPKTLKEKEGKKIWEGSV